MMRIAQAPSANLVTAMITATTADRTAPNPWMTMLLRQPGSRLRQWCLVMPACDSVKPVNTPMA